MVLFSLKDRLSERGVSQHRYHDPFTFLSTFIIVLSQCNCHPTQAITSTPGSLLQNCRVKLSQSFMLNVILNGVQVSHEAKTIELTD